jgi:hypothetical protein
MVAGCVAKQIAVQTSGLVCEAFMLLRQSAAHRAIATRRAAPFLTHCRQPSRFSCSQLTTLRFYNRQRQARAVRGFKHCLLVLIWAIMHVPNFKQLRKKDWVMPSLNAGLHQVSHEHSLMKQLPQVRWKRTYEHYLGTVQWRSLISQLTRTLRQDS